MSKAFNDFDVIDLMKILGGRVNKIERKVKRLEDSDSDSSDSDSSSSEDERPRKKSSKGSKNTGRKHAKSDRCHAIKKDGRRCDNQIGFRQKYYCGTHRG